MVDAAPASLPFPGSVKQKPPTFSPENTKANYDVCNSYWIISILPVFGDFLTEEPETLWPNQILIHTN